ncbi:hypothetical protein ACVJ5M_006434 [Bradyrhizobium sp. S3.7.6]
MRTATQAHLAHLAEGDLEWSPVGVRRRVAAGRAKHAAIKAASKRVANYQSLGPRNEREPLRVVVREGPPGLAELAGPHPKHKAVHLPHGPVPKPRLRVFA